ncbi:MAG TPA: RNA 2',3'-cyclic phosphodiesterase [Acidimicrobiales bacterium]|nr:RNA 2',3'-cyclic phosphodiesterase [Acidimicrobiales bacterium]
MRLFVAVRLPEDVLDALDRIARPKDPALRWTTRAQWHLTLRFLGSVEDPHAVADSLAGVPDVLRAQGFVTLEAVLGPAIAWFEGRRILQVPVSGLDPLARAVADATSDWGEPPGVPFVGHVTLARVRGRGRGDRSLAGGVVEARWPVDGFELMSSRLGPGGARYETQAVVPLYPPSNVCS